MKNNLPILMILFGLLTAALASGADFIGLGDRGGIPAVQVLAAEAGASAALIGIWLLGRQRKGEYFSADSLRSLPAWFLSQPVIVWVVLGFIVSYVLFFIFPTFLNSGNKFQYPGDFFIEREKIGIDTRLILEHVRVWYTGEREAKFLFPPLTTILATPLLLLRYPQYYHVVTAITLASYFILNLILPLAITRGKSNPLLLFIFAISVFSYGVQFELETGQFYTIAMMFCLAAIHIFHRHPHHRLFAYMFFCLSVQLKLFPMIFIVLLIEDWRDWGGNLKRFAALAGANFLLLFLLGYGYFNTFIKRLVTDASTQQLEYNHSIYAFVRNLASSGYGMFSGSALDWIRANLKLIEISLYGYFFLCLMLMLILAYRQNRRGINAALLMVCVLGGLMLISLSHDYKLPLLTAPFMLAVSNLHLPQGGWKRLAAILLTILASSAYSATLVPWNARPVYLHNAFPLLFLLLTVMTVLGFVQENECEDL